jgi:hypothetical protein
MSREMDEFLERYITRLRAPTRKVTRFGPGGRARGERSGEKVIYGPDGSPLRIVEHPGGGVQVEEGDRKHAVIRPPAAVLDAKGQRP